MRVDIAIIGTGPAGLEAAITAKVRNKSVLLLGQKGLSSKLKTHRIDNYLGFPKIKGEDLAKAFETHLEASGITITEDRINAIYDMGDCFALNGKETYEATAVILATGVVMANPYPGEKENLGSGVSYCATCDAAMYRGKKAIVIGAGKEAEEESAFLAELADAVTYVPLYKETPVFPEAVQKKITVVTKKPERIKAPSFTTKVLVFADGTSEEADGIFVLRESVFPDQLLYGLETDKNAVKVDRSMKTSVPGVFACGDITGAPYQYIKSAGEGNVAALSAVSYVTAKNQEK